MCGPALWKKEVPYAWQDNSEYQRQSGGAGIIEWGHSFPDGTRPKSPQPKARRKKIIAVDDCACQGHQPRSCYRGFQQQPIALKSLRPETEVVKNMDQAESAQKWQNQQVSGHSALRAVRGGCFLFPPQIIKTGVQVVQETANTGFVDKLLRVYDSSPVRCNPTQGVFCTPWQQSSPPVVSPRHLGPQRLNHTP